MADTFDPYHQWLGIPPDRQPPDHYRLLGLQPREAHPEVIRAAADRQTVHLRSFAKGARAETAKRLLGEVAHARACLLDPIQKAAYDRELPATPDAAAGSPGDPFSASGLDAAILEDAFRQPTEGEPALLPRLRKRRPSWRSRVMRVKTPLIVGAVLVLVVTAAAVIRVGLRKVGRMIQRPAAESTDAPAVPADNPGPSVAAALADAPPKPLDADDQPSNTLPSGSQPSAAQPSAAPPSAKLVRTLLGHRRPVCGVAFSPDGETLATVAKDGNVRLWDAASGELRWNRRAAGDKPDAVPDAGPIPPRPSLNTLAFSPDGKALAVAGDDATVRLFAAADGTPGKTLAGHSAPVRSIVFSPDGSRLASAGLDKTIRVWDPTTGATARHWPAGDAVLTLAVSPDGQTLASAGLDGAVRLWRADSGEPAGELKKHVGPIRAVAFAPDGKTLASAGDDRTVVVWDVAARTARRAQTAHADRVSALAFSPDGRSLASGGYLGDRTIRFSDTTAGADRDPLPARAAVASLCFSPDGRHLAAATYDGRVRLWAPSSLAAKK